MRELFRFTDEGIAEFRARIEHARIDRDLTRLVHLSQETEFLNPTGIEIDLPSNFSSRLECGRFFDSFFERNASQLLDLGLDARRDVGLWAWLSASMALELGSSSGDGVGEVARWVFEPGKFSRHNRHLLAGPYNLYRRHKGEPLIAEMFLYNEVTRPNTAFVEQLASRPLICENPEVLRLACRMYFDPTEKCLVEGSGSGPGSIRRFGVVLNQLSRIWDLFNMSEEEVAAVFPSEFARLL